MKSLAFIMGLIMACFMMFNPCNSIADESLGNPKISFLWAFGALKNVDDSFKVVKVDRGTRLKQGDQIRMSMKLGSDCYVYVIYKNSMGEFGLLFPETFGSYQVNKKFFIPNGEDWFVFDDNKGKENFYLLASTIRLTKLEKLISAYTDANSPNQTDLASQIQSEINKTIKQNRKSLLASAERPVSIGGAFRGVSKKKTKHSISQLSIRIVADSFYSKIYSIRHE